MKEIQWINGAKFIAIMAVILDHTHGILYFDGRIAMGTHFSVALFVFISGITSYISLEKYDENWWKTFLEEVKKYLALMFLQLLYTS